MNATAASTTPAARPAGDKLLSRPAWLLLVLLIAAAQTGFVFLLGARHPIQPGLPWPTPPITLVGDKNAALAEVTDPTVFILPNRHGFSGAARAMTPHNPFVTPGWSEPYHWLPLAADQLGLTVRQLLATDATPPVQIAEKTEPRLAPLATVPALTLPTHSTLRIDGNVASRSLLSPASLPDWPGTDELKASEVQVIVDAGGRVVSAALLAGSELAEADQRALEVARTARFGPATNGSRDLVWGRMVFVWHTVPLPTPGEIAVPQPLP